MGGNGLCGLDSTAASQTEQKRAYTLTEVGDANAARKVQHLPAVPKRDIRALGLGQDRVDDTTEPGGDMLLAELHEGLVRLRGCGCHVAFLAGMSFHKGARRL